MNSLRKSDAKRLHRIAFEYGIFDDPRTTGLETDRSLAPAATRLSIREV